MTAISLKQPISTVCKSAFYYIRTLLHICKSLTDVDMTKAVSTSLIQSCLAYANSLLHGISKSNLNTASLNSMACNSHIVL